MNDDTLKADQAPALSQSATRPFRQTFDGYQMMADRTGAAHTPTMRMVVAALGLAGESGEVADLVKKAVGHGHTLNKEKVAEELGDILWYIASMASALGIALSDIAHDNLEKLRKRYPDGFSSERSINRET